MPPFIALAAAAVSAAKGGLTRECVKETYALQSDNFLNLVQNDLYDQFQDDYNSVCEFGGTTSVPDCGFEFDGNNKTYAAACEAKGGQVLTRPVKLNCGQSLASVDLGLGSVPTCIGISCDAAEIIASDNYTEQLMDARVEEFFNNLSFTGCSADHSGATTQATPLMVALLTAGTAGAAAMFSYVGIMDLI